MENTARRSALPATTNVLILLCAMYFISYIVRQNVSTAIIAIRPEFHLSNTQAGLIFSAFGYPYLLFQIIGGVTADRFGPRRTLFVSGLVWAGATVLTSVAWDFYSLFAARILMGFGVGATLMILPVVSAVGFFFIGLTPTLAVLVAFQVIRRAGEYAIARPAREILFTVLNREEKYKSKNFIDTVVFRGGDAVSGWLFEGLRVLGLGFAGIAFVSVPIALLWAGTGWMLGRTQDEVRAKYEAIRRPDEQTTQSGTTSGAAGTGSDQPVSHADPVDR